MNSMSDIPRIEQIHIKNYKSIEECDVLLQPITYIIGANGSGKSNFLDAICFVRDIYKYDFFRASESHGGLLNIKHENDQTIQKIVIMEKFPSLWNDYFKYENYGEGIIIKIDKTSYYDDDSKFIASKKYDHRQKRLIIEEFITNSSFHNFSPEVIREVKPPSMNHLLTSNGSNLCSVLRHISQEKPDIKRRIDQYLSVVVPGLSHVNAVESHGYEFLEFHEVNGRQFTALNMSDGTLRALGILTALLQDSPLVGIEEPETALHPAAAGVLHDAIREASLKKQVIVTSHSPDLLDDPNLDPDSILVTTMENGSTRIAPLGNASREAIKTHLYTAGELLRMNQLTPEPVA
jgi:predicted ATPase